MAIATVVSASSCNKCGYCDNSNNPSNGYPQDNGSAVCQSSNPIASLDGESYKQVKADCSAQGGVWVVTKQFGMFEKIKAAPQRSAAF